MKEIKILLLCCIIVCACKSKEIVIKAKIVNPEIYTIFTFESLEWKIFYKEFKSGFISPKVSGGSKGYIIEYGNGAKGKHAKILEKNKEEICVKVTDSSHNIESRCFKYQVEELLLDRYNSEIEDFSNIDCERINSLIIENHLIKNSIIIYDDTLVLKAVTLNNNSAAYQLNNIKANKNLIIEMNRIK